MDELYKQNAKIVSHFLYSLCHEKALAEELTQETFFQAYQSLDRYDGSCKVSSWLCQIAKHLYYQHLQKTKHEVLTDFSEAETNNGEHQEQQSGVQIRQKKAEFEEKTTERQVMARLELLDVLKEMQKLPAQMREVMYLRITGDLSFQEIGEILGRSENWARVNFYRGKEILLKRRMQDE